MDPQPVKNGDVEAYAWVALNTAVATVPGSNPAPHTREKKNLRIGKVCITNNKTFT